VSRARRGRWRYGRDIGNCARRGGPELDMAGSGSGWARNARDCGRRKDVGGAIRTRGAGLSADDMMRQLEPGRADRRIGGGTGCGVPVGGIADAR